MSLKWAPEGNDQATFSPESRLQLGCEAPLAIHTVCHTPMAFVVPPCPLSRPALAKPASSDHRVPSTSAAADASNRLPHASLLQFNLLLANDSQARSQGLALNSILSS